jgi:hypothetical protein
VLMREERGDWGFGLEWNLKRWVGVGKCLSVPLEMGETSNELYLPLPTFNC